jgi:beta-galactosidase
VNTKHLFNDGWEFVKMPMGTTLEDIQGTHTKFEPIDIPHDWLIYNTLDLYEDSVGFYRKKFVYIVNSQERVALRFDGVYMNTTVFVNDAKVGEWKYGYSTFEWDITDYLQSGENEIKVQVIHQSPNSRWYSGAGIYRNVWLKTYPNTHIVSDGIYISTQQQEGEWQVEIETEIETGLRYGKEEFANREVTLVHCIKDRGKVIDKVEQRIQKPSMDQDTINQVIQKLWIKDPVLWDIEKPYLYTLETRLLVDGVIIQAEREQFGFRSMTLHPEKGFLLNGKSIKLNGVCEHHDLGCLGAAFNKVAMRKRLETLQEMGTNAVRTAHNMPAKEVMELADEMGILIVSEGFDMWERPKTQYDYARFFKDWVSKDVASWIRRDRNHPSVILWSIGNEIYDTHADERGQEVTRLLMNEVLKHDPKQNAFVTIGSNFMPWENAQKCADIVKIAGYNYAEKYYEAHHQAHPDWVIYGSETASTVQSRGVYHFPYEKSVLADEDEQCSSLGNSSTSWGAKSSEACIIAHRDAKFTLGQFIWTGFDYIGEPTPYHTKNSYFGQIDTAGFKKDSFYIYQAEWTDYKTAPMIHIFPYWDFNEGQMIDVRVCSNAPRIELQLNGESVGSFNIDHQKGKQLVGWWKIPYTRGELKAIAYDEEGNVIATDVKKSFGDAKSLVLKPDKKELIANGQDLIFLEISVEDEKGNAVENANNRVEVCVKGAGRLIGLDNGDSTDYDAYKGTSRRLFSGKLLAVIGAKVTPGPISIEVSSPGLEAKSIDLMAIPQSEAATTQSGQEKEIETAIRGVSAFVENKQLPLVMGAGKEEVPVRKIELSAALGNEFNKDLKQIEVEAKLYPQNASYQELQWCVVNDAGIPSNCAVVVPHENGKKALITALGDGNFRLRCMTKNGTTKVKLISQLEFAVTGLGRAYKNPYAFISGGLYDYSQGEVSNGNEKGVATSRDGKTVVGFRDIDFGAFGSNRITMPIFALSSEPYLLQIWEGIPGEEGSLLVADVVYQKESKWNVYQEETFTLSKRLKGITTLCFVLTQKIHIKGFWFEKINKAFEILEAKACDRIYGDHFKVTEFGVEEIGNNVSLEFEEMDFGNEGATKLMICGKSPISKNTIQIRFSSEEGDSYQIVEFEFSNDYVEKEFTIERVKGMQKVTFVFLPGSKFDFKGFCFKA